MVKGSTPMPKVVALLFALSADGMEIFLNVSSLLLQENVDCTTYYSHRSWVLK